jgi:hypothetical protein
MNVVLIASLVGLCRLVVSHAIEAADSPDRKLLMLISSGGRQTELDHCFGNCDSDSDCRGDLVCFEHFPYQQVPSCRGGELIEARSNFCVFPILFPPTQSPKLDHCESDCDVDSDCGTGLICFEHASSQLVPGCPSVGELDLSVSDYCIYATDLNPPTPSPVPPATYNANTVPTTELVFVGNDPPGRLGPCEGDCDSDEDCGDGLICFQREHGDPVPGCPGVDLSKTDYCIPLENRLPTTEAKATQQYTPGKLTVIKHGLLLSEGLDVRLVATTGQNVTYADGSASQVAFHGRPDGGASFPDSRAGSEGNWIYVSNSEILEEGGLGGLGGVGAITFDSNGNAVDYKMVLSGTTANCGGGRTPHGTWYVFRSAKIGGPRIESFNKTHPSTLLRYLLDRVSCEENQAKGEIYQVDPTGQRSAEKVTLGEMGNFESFAYDVRDPLHPHFYITEDSEFGALRRYSPSNPSQWTDSWAMLHGDAVVDYLVLSADGTYQWTTNKEAAKRNAQSYYPFSEGIDVVGSQIFFVCKKVKEIFTLNLDTLTWQKASTRSGLFNGKPDQISRILGSTDGLLYFTEEDGLNSGIHARDKDARFYTIVEAISFTGETTGLSISPDGRFMVFAYQEMGLLYQIWRQDGLAFDAKHLDVKYHDA